MVRQIISMLPGSSPLFLWCAANVIRDHYEARSCTRIWLHVGRVIVSGDIRRMIIVSMDEARVRPH